MNLLMHSTFDFVWFVIVCLMVNQWVKVWVELELGFGLVLGHGIQIYVKTFGDFRTLMSLQVGDLSWYGTLLTLQHSERKTSYMPTMTLYRQLNLWVKYMQMKVVIIAQYLLELGCKHLSTQTKIFRVFWHAASPNSRLSILIKRIMSTSW